MSNSDTIDLLQQHLDKDPSNQLTRGVLADLLMETDPVAGEAVMWLVEFDKYPDFSQDLWWWDCETLLSPTTDNSRLPVPIFALIRKAMYGIIEKGRLFYDTCHFPSRHLAEEIIIEIYRATSEERRRGWWAREVVSV